MTLVSWAKKELARLKPYSPKKLLPPPTTLKTPAKSVMPSQMLQNQISEVILAADLKCIKCQERVAAILSSINNDLESMIVHVVEKKVTLTRKTVNQ